MTPDLAFLLAYEAPRHDRQDSERERCARMGTLGTPSLGFLALLVRAFARLLAR